MCCENFLYFGFGGAEETEKLLIVFGLVVFRGEHDFSGALEELAEKDGGACFGLTLLLAPATGEGLEGGGDLGDLDEGFGDALLVDGVLAVLHGVEVAFGCASAGAAAASATLRRLAWRCVGFGHSSLLSRSNVEVRRVLGNTEFTEYTEGTERVGGRPAWAGASPGPARFDLG